MSGIAGIVGFDRGCIDRVLLRRMTDRLVFRGPDGQGIWTNGAVGLGHALLAHGNDPERERQPATINQQTWIVADARLDAREELVKLLRANNGDLSVSASDAQLLLHAYESWGEACLDRISGDFVFAIWDMPRQELFCACDQFGIKALYYAEVDGCFVFSNTLDCVRLHPGVSDRLNDAAIADFLLFGINHDAPSTSFSDIRRLPRAHCLRRSRSASALREYWRPPTNGSIHYKRRQDYVEHFSELLTSAVEDRLRTNKVGILLSGGLDSSSVAATACELRKEKYPALDLHAFTSTLERVPSNGDEPAARAVAAALRISHHFWSLDRTEIFENWEDPKTQWPEPIDDPFAGNAREEAQTISETVSVLLSGEGSDNLMEFEMAEHLRGLWRERSAGRIFLDLAEHIWHRFQAADGLRGPLGRVQRLFSKREDCDDFPEWIQPELAARLNLKARWIDPLSNLPWKSHWRHPTGYGSLFLPQWDYLFRQEDPGMMRRPLEVRYPFLDLRLVNYLLAIPAMPWFFRKRILREAMRGKLPETIRKRPKTPVAGDAVLSALRGKDVSAFIRRRPAVQLEHYVDVARLPSLKGEMTSEEAELKLRPICLNFWLCALQATERRHSTPAALASRSRSLTAAPGRN